MKKVGTKGVCVGVSLRSWGRDQMAWNISPLPPPSGFWPKSTIMLPTPPPSLSFFHPLTIPFYLHLPLSDFLSDIQSLFGCSLTLIPIHETVKSDRHVRVISVVCCWMAKTDWCFCGMVIYLHASREDHFLYSTVNLTEKCNISQFSNFILLYTAYTSHSYCVHSPLIIVFRHVCH